MICARVNTRAVVYYYAKRKQVLARRYGAKRAKNGRYDRKLEGCILIIENSDP